MPYKPWLAILICLALGLSGCMKAVEKAAVPPVAPVRIELNGPYDGDIPREYRDRLLGVDAADWTIPQIFLAVAGHFETEGEERKALHFLDKAAEVFAGRYDSSGEALIFCRKILLLMNAGREREALDLLREGSEKWTDPPLRAFPEYVDGRLALLRGDFTRAREFLRRSLQGNADFQTDVNLLQLKRDTELAAGMAAVLSDHLPRLLAAYGLPGTAGPEKSHIGEGKTHLREALVMNRELRQTRIGPFMPASAIQRSEAEAYAFLGLDMGMQGSGEESLRHLLYAAELSRRAGFREGEIQSFLFLGELGFIGINARDGLRAAETVRERADLYRAAPYRIWERHLLARYYREEGRIGEAIAALQEADAILVSRRSGAEAKMFAQICRRQRRTVYEALVVLLAGEGRAGEAFTAAEKAKALLTVDLLAGEDIGRSPAERELLRREMELGETIRILQQRILHISGEVRTGEFLAQLKDAEAAYRELIGRMGAENEKLLSLVSVRGIDVPSLQRLLDGDTTLFDYFTTDTSLYVWAIQRKMVHLERIALTREELRSLVFTFLDAIRDKNKRRTDSIARKAYDLLLKPVIPFVSGERIGFIPDDSLFYLPFAAMRYRGKYLAEGFSLFQLSDAGLLEQVMSVKEPSGLRILAFGDPDLENESLDLHRAVEELALIRKRIGHTTVLLNEQASEAKAAEMIEGYDIFHFAVRGLFDPDVPLRSGLLLTPGAGQDGTLSALEIYRLRYPGRAVVLSGCDTLPEKDPEGKAGSSSVVSTLWLIEDRAASHLLDLFYRQLAKKESLSDSLRAAQLRLLREGHPPYVWAAFVLTGKY
jgi:CHAT domain-containing protein/tetratricopeptide (TPR) repeat protein